MISDGRGAGQNASQDHHHISDLEDAAGENLANSRNRLEESAGTSSSLLENLPAELRTLLLSSMPDLPTLRSIVHASPVLHAQYRYDRNSILRACLDRELDGFFTDAYATVKSRVGEIGSPRTDEAITGFLDTYHAWLSGATAIPDMKSIKTSRISWLAAYHISVARPLARMYSKWALTNLRKAVSSPAGQDGVGALTATVKQGEEKEEQESKELETDASEGNHDTKLSRCEEIRIYRALYRYDTYYHLFGQNHGRRHGSFRHHEIHELFFSLFDPWEAEAIGCIDIFVRHKYEDIFNQIKKDLDPKNDRFRQENGVYNPEGSYDLELEYDDYLNGTIARGLKMTVRLLRIDDHQKLVSKMERCLTHFHWLDSPLGQVLGSMAQNDRREMSINFPNTRDEAEQRQDAIKFVGDDVPPIGPPIAWVHLWGGKYVNIYGDYVPEPARQWGYVMWDERRWNDLGALELVARQWKTSCDLIEEIEMDYNWRPVGY
ncbi:hypothetical protein SCAR479_10034 [Seiridium cardinale]|uniref:F-box domain-containing protein n=1 Tax=Seiridium cardinale TaxID=138064 RepID=A0ABR2XI11_9PEZI